MVNLPLMGRVTRVINRNGEVVPFRRNRIVRAILAAVRAAGSKDEWVADKLADMVVYFLDTQHGERAQPPGADDVDDMIEKALLSSPDLHAVAKAFLASRQQRREIRELEETIAAEPGPQVAKPDLGLGGWNRAYIAAAVMREHKLDASTAGEVAETVERKVLELELARVTTGLIRELVDVELFSRGLIAEPGSLSIPRFDIDQWVFPGEETDAPPISEQAELADRAARRLMTQYGLSILPPEAREAHLDARVHFESLHAPAAVAAVRLDVSALLGSGAGFGLQRMFAETTAGVGAALARLATTVSSAAAFCAGPVALKGLDRALAGQARDEPDAIERAQLIDGLRLLAAQARAGLLIEVGPPGSAARDLVVRTLIDALASAEGTLRRQVQLELAITPGAFADAARRSLIERAASAASFCGAPAFRLREPAVAGLAARARYLERVAMRDLPEPVPASSRMLRALVGASRGVELVPVGLGLAAALLARVEDEADPAAQRVAQQVLSYLGFKFRERASRAGLAGSLGTVVEQHVPVRLAREDVLRLARENPDAPQRMRLARDNAYRPGAMLDESLPLTDRLESEGALHSLLGRDAAVAVESVTAAEVLELVRACTSEGGPQPCRFTVVVNSRTCRDCGARYPAHREACPVCGSTAWALPPGQKSLFG
jgi:hypothetical protein